MLSSELPQLLVAEFTPPHPIAAVVPHGLRAYTVADGWHVQGAAVPPSGWTDTSKPPSQPFWTVQVYPLHDTDASVAAAAPGAAAMIAWHTVFAGSPRHERPNRSFVPQRVTFV